MAQEKRLVWDLPLRLFHWLLVLTLIALWVTAAWVTTFYAIVDPRRVQPPGLHR